MAITPQDLIVEYHNIRVMSALRDGKTVNDLSGGLVGPWGALSAIVNGSQTVAIRRYRSSITGDAETGDKRQAVRSDFIKFVNKTPKSHYGEGQNGATHERTGNLVRSPQIPLAQGVSLSTGEIKFRFTGTGLPDDFRRLLTVLDLYLAMATPKADVEKHITTSGRRMTLQEFADAFLGIDCNGFVGAYLLLAHPKRTEFVDQTEKRFAMGGAYGKFVYGHVWEDGKRTDKMEKKTRVKSRQYERLSAPSDVVAGCLLVDPPNWIGGQHVAIVTSVSPVEGQNGVNVTTVESRSATNSEGNMMGPTTKTAMLNWYNTAAKPDVSDYGYWKHGRHAYKLCLKPRDLPSGS